MPSSPPSPDATEYILGELTRRLNEVASRLEVGLGRMDGVYVRRDVYDQAVNTTRQEHATQETQCTARFDAQKARSDSLEARLKLLEDGRTWLLRLVSGSLVTGLIAILYTVIQSSGK